MISVGDRACNAWSESQDLKSTSCCHPAVAIHRRLAMFESKDALVGWAFIGVLVTIVVGAAVVQRASDKVDLETRKVRFAGAMFTGMLILFVFVSLIYYADVNEL